MKRVGLRSGAHIENSGHDITIGGLWDVLQNSVMHHNLVGKRFLLVGCHVTCTKNQMPVSFMAMCKKESGAAP